VSIGPREGRRLRPGRDDARGGQELPQSELAALVKDAHEKICPYSHATRNNVDVKVEVAGG